MTARNSTEVESSWGRWIRSGGALSQDHRSLASIGRPPIMVFAIGVEHSLYMSIDRPQGRDAREVDRAATFGCANYHLRCCEDDWRAAFR